MGVVRYRDGGRIAAAGDGDGNGRTEVAEEEEEEGRGEGGGGKHGQPTYRRNGGVWTDSSP